MSVFNVNKPSLDHVLAVGPYTHDIMMARLTLFVRNLPYNTTDEDLATVFSHYGQLKRCFTVKEKSKNAK